MSQTKNLVAIVGALELVFLLVAYQERLAAQDAALPSPYARDEEGVKLLAYVNERGGAPQGRAFQSPHARHAALAVLQSLPDTTAYLGTPVVDFAREEMREAIIADIEAAVWADLNCVPGEGGVRPHCDPSGRAIQGSVAARAVGAALRDSGRGAFSQRSGARAGVPRSRHPQHRRTGGRSGEAPG